MTGDVDPIARFRAEWEAAERGDPLPRPRPAPAPARVRTADWLLDDIALPLVRCGRWLVPAIIFAVWWFAAGDAAERDQVERIGRMADVVAEWQQLEAGTP